MYFNKKAEKKLIKKKRNEIDIFFRKKKEKKESFEPDSNQRPKDDRQYLYSPPLYQLSYRRNYVVTVENLNI